MRYLRRIRWVLLGLLGLVLIGLIGFWFYLQSGAAANLVARELSQSINAPVSVKSLSVGGSETVLSGVELQEPPASPLAKVEKVRVDLSFWNVLFQKLTPGEVTLTQPELTLRFDADGKLLTRFPSLQGGGGGGTSPLPSVTLKGGKLNLVQEGHPDVSFEGIDAVIASANENLSITGSINDRAWGEWTVQGTFDTTTQATFAKLETREPRHVDPSFLSTAPFVPARVWDNVRVEAETPAEIILRFDPRGKGLSYRVALWPSRAKVQVPSIDLRTENTAGHVVIEDGLVTLARLRGDTAKGLMRVDGTLDFRSEDESVLHLNVDADRLNVQDMPEIWGVPRQVEGRLTGKANLDLHLPWQGGVRTGGTGRGVIYEAKLLGWPVAPVVINLGPVPGPMGFVFQPMPKELPPPPPVRSWPVQILKGIAYLLNESPEGKDGKVDTSFLTINLTLRDISVAEGLKQLGLTLPVELDGQATISAAVGIPTESTGDWRTYRIKGTVSTEKLKVNDVTIEKAKSTISLDRGVVSFSDLTGNLVGVDKESSGSFRADGNLTLKENYPYRANVILTKAPLSSIERFAGKFPLEIRGDLTTSANLTGNLSPFLIEGDGTATVKNLRVGIFPLDNLTFQYKADRDKIAFSKIDASSGTGKLTGELSVPLTQQGTGSAALKLDGYDLGEISKQFPATTRLKLEGTASGAVRVTIPKPDAMGKREINAELDLQAPKLKLQNLPAERITGSATYSDQLLKYRLAGDTLGGKFEVNGQYPPQSPEPKGDKNEPPLGRLQLKGLKLGQAWEALNLKDSLGSLDAEVSLDFPFRLSDNGILVGAGDLRIDRPSWDRREFAPRLTAVVRLTEDSIRIENLTSALGEGSIRGVVIVNRQDPDRSRIRLALSNVPSSKLVSFAPEFANSFSASIDANISGTLGREVRLAGTVVATRGDLFGVPVSDLRIPVNLAWATTSGRAELRIRDISGLVGGGRVTGSWAMDFARYSSPRLDTEIQFSNINVQALTSKSEYFSGTTPLSGRLDLHASNWKSVDDLRGTLKATGPEGHAFAIPVLSNLLPFLGFSSGSRNQRADVQAVLSQGTWRLQKFYLYGKGLDLMAEGTVSLRGNLQLEVIARTGDYGIDSRLLQLAALLPAAGNPVPVRIVTETSRVLANRVIRLAVTGTVRQPHVRFKPLELLSDEAVRYFLNRLIGTSPAVRR